MCVCVLYYLLLAGVIVLSCTVCVYCGVVCGVLWCALDFLYALCV